jgi:hypothetical protein
MKNILVLFFFGIGFIFQSCKDSSSGINITASNAVQIDTSEGSCPFLTKDSKGNLVLSWIKKIDSSTSEYCYAVSKDEGKTFGKAIVIPGSTNIHPHGENMPKIIFKPSGGIIAAWASANPNPKNSYSDIVYYSQSSDNGSSWTKPEKLVTDTAGYDQRYFDMALTENGEVAICWLDNRKQTTGEGSALYFAETIGNKGFQNGRRIAEPCCPCCRTDLYVDSKKNIHIVYRAIIHDSIRDMMHTVSNNNGETFSAPKRISNDNWAINGCPHTGPAMTENENGIQFSWFTGGRNAGVYYCNSTDEGKTFSPRQMVSGAASKHCQIICLNDKDIAVAWNETFFKGNTASSRIGIEVRDAKGNDPVKSYITSDKGNATFPVIKSINQNAALVAYTETVNNKDYVKYKVVDL